MTKIILNEWTEIEVLESKAEIKKLIAEKVWAEKQPYCWKDFHFIELTMIHISIESAWFFSWKCVPVPNKKEVKTDVYYKRILLIYED